MAEWAARSVKKTCETCEKLADPENYPQGVRAKIFEAYDCENCEVVKNAPNEENENIIVLYNNLPQNFGEHGLRLVSATDIKFVLELFEVDEGLWGDYYQRLVYFHACYSKACLDERERKRKDQEWRAKIKKTRGGKLH